MVGKPTGSIAIFQTDHKATQFISPSGAFHPQDRSALRVSAGSLSTSRALEGSQFVGAQFCMEWHICRHPELDGDILAPFNHQYEASLPCCKIRASPSLFSGVTYTESKLAGYLMFSANAEIDVKNVVQAFYRHLFDWSIIITKLLHYPASA